VGLAPPRANSGWVRFQSALSAKLGQISAGVDTEAKEANAALLGPPDRSAQPFAVGLRLLISRHLAMQAQHMHDDVFGHHRIAARRLDLAERRLWQSGVVDECLDPSRAAEHRLEVGQRRDRVEVRPHECEIGDFGRVPDIGEDADLQLRQQLGERVAPALRSADLVRIQPIDQQRHTGLPSSYRQ
jgi:hypothetical protein